MNSKNKFVSIVFILGALGALLFAFSIIKPEFDSFMKESKANSENDLSMYEKRLAEAKTIKTKQDKQLKEIKPIYESTIKVDGADGLGNFGSMFDNIIKLTNANKLYIRSIEYKMNPDTDELYSKFSKIYNACELKLFVVTTYGDLLRFLKAIEGGEFEYLAGISNLSVSSFSGNTDYILANISITMYTKNPTK